MKHNQTLGLKNKIIAIMTGSCISMIISLALLSLEATLVLKGSILMSAKMMISIGIHIIAAYIGCIVAGKIGKGTMLLIVSGVIIVSIVVHGFIAAFSSQNGLGNFFAFVIPEIIGASLAVLTLTASGSHQKSKHLKKRYL